MVILINCSACQKDEGINIIGTTVDGLNEKELTALIKTCIYRCDPCFADRLFILEEEIKEKQKAKAKGLTPQKPKLVVKRSG